MACGTRAGVSAGWCKVTTASFTYLGVGFDTANGSSGFIAANDGSGTVAAKSVIIVGGTEQEREGFWLEFSPDDAIGLAQGIIDAAEHAKGWRGVSNDYSSPDERFAHIPLPPGTPEVDHEDADGNWRRCFVAKRWFLVTESSKHCPCCNDVCVSIVGVQDSSGHIAAGISVDADSELNAVEARELAAMLKDAADTLEDIARRNTPNQPSKDAGQGVTHSASPSTVGDQ
jgi:hypothetical protein